MKIHSTFLLIDNYRIILIRLTFTNGEQSLTITYNCTVYTIDTNKNVVFIMKRRQTYLTELDTLLAS